MTTDEKQAFSERLTLALKRNAKKVKTSTDLALQFNLRHPTEPITPQAAYKWLNGSAKPTGDKIKTLAEWLNVSAHWLRHGWPDGETDLTKDFGITGDEKTLLTNLRKLSEDQWDMISYLVDQLVSERKAKKR